MSRPVPDYDTNPQTLTGLYASVLGYEIRQLALGPAPTDRERREEGIILSSGAVHELIKVVQDLRARVALLEDPP